MVTAQPVLYRFGLNEGVMILFAVDLDEPLAMLAPPPLGCPLDMATCSTSRGRWKKLSHINQAQTIITLQFYHMN